MSIEGGDSPIEQLRAQLSPARIRRAEEPMGEHPKISLDYTNAWAFLPYVAYERAVDKLQPIRHYEEYFRGKEREPKEVVDYIMALSDPEAVAVVDHAVDEFNADLDRIKREEDWEAVNNFVVKMKKLMGKE